ncbi:aminopeptidase N [Streptosporangium becharense]|uniref:Aminopeptidase N n=1 Tax=Streptosporangium becharense TaxID=1816182 RepID=A0A7W9IMC7_9ACTN|nr:M1 family metallopeptidase [Streptosporangium becharense]MBB2910503.1 aminopeptidase N [Streptosporangium becharense]MBB5823246.1 aminopeptidase N [Streptosporangium becharense]
MALPDPHSHRDDTQPTVEHLSWDVRADFDSRVLDAVAELRLAGARPGPLDLDTRDLEITSVTAGDAELAWELGAPDPVMGSRLRIELPEGAGTVRIAYRTSPGSTALQWCLPEQTADGTHPFLYSQCQTIHARSMVPIQDTPAVRFSYEATLRVPAELTALMSATTTSVSTSGDEGVYGFRQDQTMPSYLLALAVGRLDGKEIGPRSIVWAEPSVLEAAAWEFAEVEEMVTTAEDILGPYAWGRVDLLVLPPSYPYGGMENPQLIFLTPTLITGDRSLVALLAHEIAHAWTGNLVTAASLDHFWVNEGFTIYAEREITSRMVGRDLTELQAAVGRSDLEKDLHYLADRPELTCLRLRLNGVDPDVASSYVALEKGYLFLRAIAESVGADRFRRFLRDYLDTFRFRALTGEDVVAYARAELSEAVDYDEWLFGTGLPDDAPTIVSPLLDAVRAVGQTVPDEETAGRWSADEWQAYLAGLRAPLPAELMEELDARFGLTTSANQEILRLWLLVALRSGYRPAVPATIDLLGRVGRLKFLKPLYDALADDPETRELAEECFARNGGRYHPIATTVITARLAKAAQAAQGEQSA